MYILKAPLPKREDMFSALLGNSFELRFVTFWWFGKDCMTIYVWHTGHQINEHISHALHAGIPQNILKHTEWADNYIGSTNKHVAVGYGILRGTGDIFHHNAHHGIDYYEVDRGYINPNHFDGHYRISKNGMQAKYVEKDLPSDRLDKLKFKRENWFNPKGKIIVCPPSDYIENYYRMPHKSWEYTFKRFPLNVEDSNVYKIRNKSDTTPLEYDLKDAKCVLTFNSNVAVDATIKGIPVLAGWPSIVDGWSPISRQDILQDKLQPPTDEQINKLLRFISYNQFTLEEIRNGTAWRLLHE